MSDVNVTSADVAKISTVDLTTKARIVEIYNLYMCVCSGNFCHIIH